MQQYTNEQVMQKALDNLARQLAAAEQARDRLLLENARLKRQIAALKKNK